MFGFKKNNLKEFLNDKSVAIVHIYGDNISIDGKDVSEFENVKGKDGEKVVKLSGGTHKVITTHRTTTLSFKFKTQPIESELPLENGHSYTFGIYEYSKALLDANKDNPRMQYVYYLPMEGAAKEFGIICFKDE